MGPYIQKFFTSRKPVDADDYVGQQGRLWFDEVDKVIFYSDGTTPGGFPVTGGSGNIIIGGTYGNANVASYLPSDPTITSIQTDISNVTIAWTANALSQQSQINSLLTSSTYGNANVAAYLTTYSGNVTAGSIYTDNYFYANGDPFVSEIPITFETLSKNLKAYPYVINRTGDTITSVVYTMPTAQTITKTLNYSGSSITSISISGPSLASTYVKTLNYSGVDIVGASYSNI